ncbi:MAG: S41 family peptidase, partial [Bacteroidota bacterium]
SEYVFDGHIYVLVNGGSVSAATFLAANLRRFGRATILGEETGGTAKAFQTGTPQYIWELPNTQLQMGVSYLQLYTGYTPYTTGRGVVPDVASAYQLNDRLAHRDLEMEKVYTLIREQEAQQGAKP